jgi:tetratricopeptide (TPR) repeat protein
LTPDQHLQADLIRAHLACDSGNLAGAERLLIQAEGWLPPSPEPLQLARINEVAARIFQLSNRYPLAADHYDRQAIYLRQARQYREMADALNRSGDLWLEAGDIGQAGDRYYRAARSLIAQGDSLAALRIIEKVVNHDQTGLSESDRLKDIADLFKELQDDLDAAPGSR